MVELIMVMVMVGILAAYAVPKLSSAISMRDDAWRDEVQASLRYAQKSAVARRRLTCVTIAATSVSVSTSSVNPANAGAPCPVALPGPNGSSTFATADNSSAGVSVSPSGVIYFQPDGRVTTDVAGATAANRTVSMSGASSITIYGETGYVE
jgi:Tfp pilus assembly protein FimT